jgi:hypothetical protein
VILPGPMTRRCAFTFILSALLWFLVEVLVWVSTKDFEDYGTWFAVFSGATAFGFCVWKERGLTISAVLLALIQVGIGAVAYVQRTVLVAESPPVVASLRDCLFSSYSVAILVLELAGGIVFWRVRRRWFVP